MYQEAYAEQASSSADRYDQVVHFESPPTPGNRRVTRSKARGVTAPPPPPMAIPRQTRREDTGEPPRKRKPGRKPHIAIEVPCEDDSSLYNVIKNCKSSMTVSDIF